MLKTIWNKTLTSSLLTGLNGYKTYLIGALIFVVGGLEALSVITHDQAEVLYGLLGGAGLVALRHGIDKK